jgi:pimeloyl-ACP methyl ester carboxylesterase
MDRDDARALPPSPAVSPALRFQACGHALIGSGASILPALSPRAYRGCAVPLQSRQDYAVGVVMAVVGFWLGRRGYNVRTRRHVESEAGDISALSITILNGSLGMEKVHISRRRMVLLSALGLGVAAGSSYLFAANHEIPAADPASQKRFRDSEDAMLARYGVPAVSRFHEIDDPRLRVHVIEAAQGEPLLFIHGGNSVAAGWIPLLAKLHQRFHLYAPDRPGCGLTTMFSYLGVPLRTHAVAFIHSVMDSLDLSRAAIVANSMGGYFALVYALAHPERVSRLVLAGEPAGSAPDIRLANRLVGTRIINSVLFASVLKPGPSTCVTVLHAYWSPTFTACRPMTSTAWRLLR